MKYRINRIDKITEIGRIGRILESIAILGVAFVIVISTVKFYYNQPVILVAIILALIAGILEILRLLMK